MPLVALRSSSWETYLDRLARAAGAAGSWVDMTGPGVPGAGEGYVPLTLIAYDVESDAITVLCGGKTHTIAHPRQVHVEHEGGWVQRVEVISGDGEAHYMVLKDALEVPPGGAAFPAAS